MVGIKDMEMPKSCAECRMKKRCEQGIAGGWREDKRIDDCPLVDIVTCKECDYWEAFDEDEKEGIGFCSAEESFPHGDDYCGEGVRKVEGESDANDRNSK